MEKYENLGLVGEGSYGMVLKCRHKDTGQLVAIKKFLESEDDKMVKKIAMREVKMLKQLRHDHLVNLIEVFRRKKRLYLVFEFVDHTVLDELEKCPNGLDETTCRKILWQVLKGTEFCHLHHIIHRDIKPENILVSKSGIVKICDFGFARTLAQPGETYTDYVATRWYRAPELLVGDTKYGKAVDIWAVGCLLSEMLTGEPLFPGDSDIDQLYHIVKCFGNLTPRHREVFLRNPLFVGMRIPEVREVQPLERKFTKVSTEALDFMKQCLRLDPDNRPTCSDLLKHNLFQRDGFASRYPIELKHKIHKDYLSNPLYKQQPSSSSQDDTDNRVAEASSSKGAQGAGAKKKKKVDAKDSTKEIKKETSTKDLKKQEDGVERSKKKTPVATSSNAATASSTPSESPDKSSPSKKTSPAANGNIVSLPPASMASTQLGGTTSIPPINQSGQTITPSSLQGSSPSIGTPSSYLAFSSFAHSMSPSIGPLGSHHYRVGGDKGVKKITSFPKKTTQGHTSTISPQPLHTEKSSLHDKSLLSDSKGKYRSPERGLRSEGVSLPEVKGAADASSRSKEKVTQKKSTVATIPHINSIDPYNNNNAQTDHYPEDEGLPTVT
ncbi:hypothetical protein BaRGS_00002013 [Batillaria attramentaria]|uniref:Cyclin-dependent kinase-like 2 n=1 Tax=Batillaria attramentaria TaxID=370345 RepID=A0ABD0M5U8_9CAEN